MRANGSVAVKNEARSSAGTREIDHLHSEPHLGKLALSL